MNAYPWIPPWLGPLLGGLAAALATIHILGRLGFATTWMHVLLAVVVVGGFVWAAWGPRIATAVVARVYRIRARRYSEEPDQVVEPVETG